jgi:hypothetical protein
MKTIIRKFESVFQFTDYLNKGSNSKLFKDKTDSNEPDRENKVGTESYEEAQKLFSFGDRKSFELIKRTANKAQLKGSGNYIRSTTQLGVVGYVPNISAYMAGSPRCMMQRTRVTRTSSKVINVLYNCAFPWSASKKEIIEQGVKVLEFVNESERKGYRVNLYASVFADRENEAVGMMVRIKSSEQALDLLKIAYPIINPSFLRRHYFRFLEVEKEISNKHWVFSYGRPVKYWVEVKDILKDSRMKIDYYFNSFEMVEVGR